MNRFDRITAILIQLQSKRVVKAQDLSERFDVSLRTIYRDIRTLEEAGVPLYGEAGVGYSIVDGYRLPPVMFTREEATAFVAAEKLMEKFSDGDIKKNFESSMYKVKSVLRTTEKDLVESLEEHIAVNPVRTENKSSGNALDILLKAISEKKAVQMTYTALGRAQANNRLMEPIGVYHEGEYWYTIGYCHLRKEYRHFRIDRIKNIVLTDKERHSERFTLKEYRELNENRNLQLRQHKVVIRVDKRVAQYLQGRKHFYGFVSEKESGDMIEMEFLTPWLEDGFARWYLMFADYAEIVEPEVLRTELNKILESISKKLAAEKIC